MEGDVLEKFDKHQAPADEDYKKAGQKKLPFSAIAIQVDGENAEKTGDERAGKSKGQEPVPAHIAADVQKIAARSRKV